MAQSKDTLESILDMQTLYFSEEESSNKKPITIWLEEEYQNKYTRLQKRSNREFSKRLQKLIMKAIDKMEVIAGLDQEQGHA